MIIQCLSKRGTAFGVCAPANWSTDFDADNKKHYPLLSAEHDDFSCVKFQQIAIGVQLIETCALIGFINLDDDLTQKLPWAPIGTPWFKSSTLPKFMLSFFSGKTLLLKTAVNTLEERDAADIERSQRYYAEGAEKLLAEVHTYDALLMRYYAETEQFFWL